MSKYVTSIGQTIGLPAIGAAPFTYIEPCSMTRSATVRTNDQRRRRQRSHRRREQQLQARDPPAALSATTGRIARS